MKRTVFLILGIVILAGCSSVVLNNGNFAWPLESVLETNKYGMVSDNRYSFSVNVKPLFFEETNDSLHINKKTVRIIRGEKGYYYFIAPGFKNVYVFTVDDGAMVLYNKIEVSQLGVDLPAFNQRKPYIELLEGEKHLFYINSEGLKENY